MNRTCLSDPDQCLGALEGSVAFENNAARVSQLARALAFAQGAPSVNSSQPKKRSRGTNVADPSLEEFL